MSRQVWHRRLPVLGLLAGLGGASVACTGNLGGNPGGGSEPPITTSGDLSCDLSLVPDSLPLRRLSRTQVGNALHEVIARTLPDEVDTILPIVLDELSKYPDDLAKGPDAHFGSFTQLDQTVHQDHIDVTYRVATTLGEELTKTPARLEAVFGTCATDADAGNDVSCLTDFVKDFGALVYRRPLKDDDVAFYVDAIGAAPFEAADFGDAVGLLINAPYFFYMVEHGDEAQDGKADVYRVDAYELASRLSFHFWQTMPDQELLDAAASGDLLTEAGYLAQVERVYADPRTNIAIEDFYRQWLHRADLDEIDSRVGTPVFDAFAGDFVPGPDTRENMQDELATMGRYYSHDVEGSFDDLFTSNRSFATTDDVAEIYDVPVWDGQGEPPEFPSDDRVGLLTRAGMVATGSANTRPIMKGVFIRKALLCGEIPPPPANAAATPPALSPDLTTREVVEELTESSGTNCAGCHASVINPLGFATENFDALGRHRTHQQLYDPETGAYLDEKPVDTNSVPQITTGDDSPSTGPADLSRLILDSGVAHSCFARVYFRYTFGRVEELDKDGCMLVALREKVIQGAPLSEVLREVALQPDFQQRLFEGQ